MKDQNNVEPIRWDQVGEVEKWYNIKKIERTMSALNKNGFQTFFVNTKKEALKKALSLISPEAKVGIGGSSSIREIGLVEALKKRGNIIAQHGQNLKEDIMEILKEELNSDIFLASSNAVTEDGKLINIDKGGNRVASMIFGPKKVLLVVGINKIVKDIDE